MLPTYRLATDTTSRVETVLPFTNARYGPKTDLVAYM